MSLDNTKQNQNNHNYSDENDINDEEDNLDEIDYNQNNSFNENLNKQNLELETSSLFPLDLTVKTSSNQKNNSNSSNQSVNSDSPRYSVVNHTNNLAKKRKLDEQKSNASNYNSEDEDNNSTNDIGISMPSSATVAAVVAANLHLNLKNMIKEYGKLNGNNQFSNNKPGNVTQTQANFFAGSAPLKQIQTIADSFLLTTQFNKEKILQNDNKSSSLQSPNNTSFSRPTSSPSPSLLVPSNITNNNTSISGAKPLKCVLPPVSQEQFDKYNLINTDDLVRKVKDLLR